MNRSQKIKLLTDLQDRKIKSIHDAYERPILHLLGFGQCMFNGKITSMEECTKETGTVFSMWEQNRNNAELKALHDEATRQLNK
jgi:hypothetical protein